MDELDTWYRDAISGDLNAIAQLENKADWRYKRDRTILHRESESGNTERVRFILREFAYKNLLTESTTYNETALHLAIDRGHTEVAKVLIKAARRHLPQTSFQAFLRKCNKNNDTALHYAVIKRHVAIVKLLVEADSTDRHSPNKQGKTPMFIAVEEGLKDIVEIISTTCEAPSLDGPNGSTAMRINTLDQVKCPDGIHYKIMDIEALYDAAIAGDADAIANLEMKVDMVYNNDATNLHIEAQDGNTERVRFILREFANKNLLAKLTIYKETALHLAIYRRHTEVAKVIIEAALRQMTETSFRAFLRQGDKDNDTALHLAVMEENVVIVKLLVEADPTHTHTQNNEGYTPMYIAVDDGFNEIVEIISTTCTAPSLNGPNGSTALRINNLDQVGSPGGPLYKIMDRDALYAAAFVDGNADVIANLEMQAERLLTGDHETILPIESQNGNTERVPFFLREFASKNLLAKLTPRKYTALHWAIYSGHTKVAETIIATARKHLPETSFQAFLRQGDEDMETALHAAVMKGNIAIVKLLVEADPTDRHAQNRRGKTPIYIAVEEGYAEIVKMICTTCTAPLNLDGPVGKHTALQAAVKNGKCHIEVVKDLIHAAKLLPCSASDNDNTDAVSSFQAFLRHGDEDMNTALHLAVMRRKVEIVKLLVDADPTDKHAQNKQGETPMYIAVEKEYNDIVEIISTTCNGAPYLDGPDGSTAVHFKNLRQVESPGGALYKIMDRNALYAAAFAGDGNVIAVLGEKANRLLLFESRGGNTERVRFILRKFANKNLLVKLDTLDKQTALHLATCYEHTEVVEILIAEARRLPETSFQAFLRHGDEDMNTALHFAVMQGNLAIVKLLVKADPADTQRQNKNGKTPIYIAVEEGFADIVKVICATCTEPLNLHGPVGEETALQAAVKNQKYDIEVVKVLIDAARRHVLFQDFLRHGDKDMNTALHLAVMRRNLEIVKLLVGADPTDKHAQNSQGKTPIYIAAEGGNRDIVKVICNLSTASLNFDGPGDSTALHAALKNRNHVIEVVEVLFNAARRSASDNDNVSSFQAFLRRVDENLNTALHVAVKRGNFVMAELLVKSDPTYPGSKNKKGKTPFLIAVEGRYTDIVKLLCSTCTSPFSFGPLGWLHAVRAVIKNLDEAENGARDVIKMIVNIVMGGVKPENTDFEEYQLLAILFEKIDDDKNSQTLLEVAVERNYWELVKLISETPNPSNKGSWIANDFISLIPLIYKAKDKKYNKMVEVLTEWYQAGAKFYDEYIYSYERSIECYDPAGHAAVITAIASRELSASNLLNYAGDFVLYPDRLGWSLLHHAAYNEFNSIITRIVEEQKRFKHEFVYKDMVSTPFLIAAEKGYTSTVILLMQLWPSYGSSAYTAVNREGQNILHLAALQNKKEMIEGILKYCPEEHKEKFVNRQDKKGQTPLHLLIKDGCFISQLMKYKQLDINLLNKENWTPPGMLYFNDQIIGDQVKIKIALHHIQHDLESDIFSSPALSITERDKKDVLFNEKSRQMKYEKYAGLKENTHAIANCFMDAISGDHISKAALEMEAERLEQEEGKIILHVESMRGVTERVEYILREFGNKNLLVKLDTSKQTALHLAVDHGHTQVVKVIIDAARHLPSSSANNLVTPFQDFVRQANGQMGNTALHLAVLKGNVAIVKLLVDADPDGSHVQNSEGKTPIYIAVEKGHKDIVKEICTTCTALSLDGPGCKTTQDESRSSVLQLAVERNCVDVVKMILEKDLAYQDGRKINRNGLMCLIYKAIDNECSDAIVKLLSQKYQVGIMPEHEKALELILAIKRRNEDSVLSLLGGAKDLVNFTQDNGWTALHYAVYHEFDSVLGAIIGAQEDVGHQFVYGDMVPTPFHVAVECGYTSTLVRLMQLWPAPSSASEADKSPYIVVNEDGRNILHLAAADNSNTKDVHRKEMVEGILKYCPEMCRDKILKQNDTNGDTPLHVIISQGYFIPELIKDKELGTKAKNQNNFTPWEMLYHKNDVVADQVHIKIAIDEVESNQSAWNLSNKRKENKNDIWKNIPPSKRRTKDVIFDEQKKILMHAKHLEKKEKLERYKMRTNTQIIVSALITTVTFTVGFTMPGGLHQSGEVDEGLVLLSKKNAFNTFMVSDAIALLLSTSSLFFYFLESINEDPHQVSKLNAASTVLNTVSVMAMMLTFVAGTYLVLSHSPALAITVCIIGSLFFLLIIILLIKIVYERLHIKRNLD